MEYKQTSMLDSSAWEGSETVTMDLFKPNSKYKAKKGECLKKHSGGEFFIRGIIPEENIPTEGGTFKMYYYNVNGKQRFGHLQLENCKNVIIEEDIIYFENETSQNGYMLKTCSLN